MKITERLREWHEIAEELRGFCEYPYCSATDEERFFAAADALDDATNAIERLIDGLNQMEGGTAF